MNNSRNDKEPTPTRGNAIDEGKNDDNNEIDEHIDDSSESGGNDDDVFGEADFAEKVASVNYGLDALRSAFCKETPHGGAA